MKPTTIFVTFNPKNEVEQTIAARLHTIGAVNGFMMYLPDRFNSDSVIDTETKRRISVSDFFVVFSMGNLSGIVKQEIEHAFKHLKDKSKILVIYDSRKGKNLKGESTEHFTQFLFDPIKDSQEKLMSDILVAISKKASEKSSTKSNDGDDLAKALIAILGIGLGLVILDALLSNK